MGEPDFTIDLENEALLVGVETRARAVVPDARMNAVVGHVISKFSMDL